MKSDYKPMRNATSGLEGNGWMTAARKYNPAPSPFARTCGRAKRLAMIAAKMKAI